MNMVLLLSSEILYICIWPPGQWATDGSDGKFDHCAGEEFLESTSIEVISKDMFDVHAYISNTDKFVCMDLSAIMINLITWFLQASVLYCMNSCFSSIHPYGRLKAAVGFSVWLEKSQPITLGHYWPHQGADSLSICITISNIFSTLYTKRTSESKWTQHWTQTASVVFF